MRAFVVEEPGKTNIINVGRPVPGTEDVLLRVRVVGMCGTDLSTFRGKNSLVSIRGFRVMKLSPLSRKPAGPSRHTYE
jgi:threonine dehydrogenase-like Zn-dependent dehydrogenase